MDFTSQATFGSFHAFNPAPLFTLRQGVLNLLAAVESSFVEFSEDAENTTPLVDALDHLHELTGVFQFLNMHGALELSMALKDMMAQFAALKSATPHRFHDAFAEGLLLLVRYYDFVLLHHALAPHLLIDTTNAIRLLLKQPLINEGDFFIEHFNKINLTLLPQPPSLMSDEEKIALSAKLRPLFQFGLAGILSKNPSEKHFAAVEKSVLFAHMLNEASANELFWHMACAAVKNLQEAYPITSSRQRVLIRIEQQLSAIKQTVDSTTFNDVLAMGLCRDNAIAQDLRQQLQLEDQLTTDLWAKKLKRYIFGPTADIVLLVSDLLSERIHQLKEEFSELSIAHPSESQLNHSIISALDDLSAVLRTLNFNDIAKRLTQLSPMIRNLDGPPDETSTNQFMDTLLIVENRISMWRSKYIPAGKMLAQQNEHIAYSELKGAQTQLIHETKQLLSLVCDLCERYASNLASDESAEFTALIEGLWGAFLFLQAPQLASALHVVHQGLGNQQIAAQLGNADSKLVNALISLISCCQHYVESLEQHIVPSRQIYHLANHCAAEFAA